MSTVDFLKWTHTFLMYGEGEDIYFNCSVTGDISIDATASVYGGLEWQHEFLNPTLIYYPIPQTAGLVNFYVNPGGFIRANALVSGKFNFSLKPTFGMCCDYSFADNRSLKNGMGGRLGSPSMDFSGSIDGDMSIGVYVETGFSLVSRKLAKICDRREMGLKVSGSFVLTNDDVRNATRETQLYERLKASSIEVGGFSSGSLVCSALGTGAIATLSFSYNPFRRAIVPTFTNTQLSHDAPSMVNAYTELSGNCLFPVPVGFKLFDEKGKEVADYDANRNYTNKNCWFDHDFNGLKNDVKY